MTSEILLGYSLVNFQSSYCMFARSRGVQQQPRMNLVHLFKEQPSPARAVTAMPGNRFPCKTRTLRFVTGARKYILVITECQMQTKAFQATHSLPSQVLFQNICRMPQQTLALFLACKRTFQGQLTSDKKYPAFQVNTTTVSNPQHHQHHMLCDHQPIPDPNELSMNVEIPLSTRQARAVGLVV